VTRTQARIWSTGGLLAAILLHNLIYPLTLMAGPGPAIFYLVYASMFSVATWFLTGHAGLRIGAVATGLAVLAAGLANSYTPSAQAALAVYLTSIAYHLVMIAVLVRHTFTAKTVMTDVVLAAAALYLVIGSAFAALFATIEWLAPGSFAASSEAAIDWQHLLYYSYVTLTTLGYGDITPVGFYAQAMAAFEAVLGVLYTVILLARLVGLHTTARAG
jgi:hypothetical protein